MLHAYKGNGSASRCERLGKNSGGAFELQHKFGYDVVSV
jgi:hypothetical protein